MKWSDLLTSKRTGHKTTNAEHSRSEFQRDYDRIIFSPPFRRLQNKTQVFPLPGHIFVHNRLTHSIEVASVGRSLAQNVITFLKKNYPDEATLFDGIDSIVSAACLAHDMGNPPFGHSGEKAIQHYFANGAGQNLANHLTDKQMSDFLNFDGNANTLRILSHSFIGRREGGFALTYPTLASIIKYPRSSKGVKKFGYFQQDEDTFLSIMQTLGIPIIDSATETYARHPLVYLVEAADDICYQAMDVEDAYRLGILTYDETRHLFMNFFDPVDDAQVHERLDRVCKTVTDTHEQVAYMRTLLIGLLVKKTTDIFCTNIDEILSGTFTKSLIAHLDERTSVPMNFMAKTAMRRIYQHQSVKQIELSGFAIIGELTDKFLQALIHQDHYYSSLILPFIPEQFRASQDAPIYDKIMSAIDTVSGMTDLYALDLYRKITGCKDF